MAVFILKKPSRVIVTMVIVFVAVLSIGCVMTSPAPYELLRKYILENATEEQKFSKTRSVILYNDGTAKIEESPLSSFMLVGTYFYTFTDDELLIHYESDNVIARFDIIDEYTIVFKEASIPLRADKGARYVISQ